MITFGLIRPNHTTPINHGLVCLFVFSLSFVHFNPMILCLNNDFYLASFHINQLHTILVHDVQTTEQDSSKVGP